MQRLYGLLLGLHPEVEFTAETPLVGDGMLDSLDIVTLATDINNAYGVSLSAEDIIPENFETPRSLSALIRARGGEICD